MKKDGQFGGINKTDKIYIMMDMNCKINLSEKHYGDCTGRPDIYGILVPGKRGRLLSVLYTPAGEGPHPVVLLLHGIPGCERNFDISQALRRAGFHVLVFHYSGSWGSDGTYSLKNDLEDADTVLDYMMADETYGFDKDHIYAVGHSMGGFVCGQLTARRREIRGGVLLMPCDIGRIHRIAEEDAQGFQTIRNVFGGQCSVAYRHHRGAPVERGGRSQRGIPFGGRCRSAGPKAPFVYWGNAGHRYPAGQSLRAA